MGKICLRICCALALVVFVSASQACAGDGGSRTADMLVQAGGRNVAWMKSLHDTLPVCKVSIPGTHDSGTVKGGPMLKRSQRIFQPSCSRASVLLIFV